MEPFSVTANIAAIITICGSVVKIAHDIFSAYVNAPVIIQSIYAETSVIAASFAQVQSLIELMPEAISSQLTSQPQLFTTFDIALTGCKMIGTLLETELQKVLPDSADPRDVDWSTKCRFILNEDTLNLWLQHIRGQQAGLTLLLQALQMESIAKMCGLLQQNTATLQQVARRTRSLRSSNGTISQLVPESILAVSESDSHKSDSRSSSMMITGSTGFAFDGTITNSRPYRRAEEGNSKMTSKDSTHSSKLDLSLNSKLDPKFDPTLFTRIQCDTCKAPLDTRLKGTSPTVERILQTECGHLHHELCLYVHLIAMGPRHMCCPRCKRPSKINGMLMTDSPTDRRDRFRPRRRPPLPPIAVYSEGSLPPKPAKVHFRFWGREEGFTLWFRVRLS